MPAVLTKPEYPLNSVTGAAIGILIAHFMMDKLGMLD